MQITRIGSDYITIDEDNIRSEELLSIPRVHLIKLDFFQPNETKVMKVISLFPKTNRYVIEDNIRIYNYILKRTSKKYYILNKEGIGLISFFRKNNKVLLNFMNVSVFEKQFLLSEGCFEDMLSNIEVILIDRDTYEEKKNVLRNWNGNVIIDEI
jgi:hypothetical protein